jgi:hypothetical protein
MAYSRGLGDTSSSTPPPFPEGPTARYDPRKRTARLRDYLDLFGARGVPLVLIAIGIGMVAADDSIEVNRVTGWGEPEYVGMLAFAALLVVLGCIERLVEMRSDRLASDQVRRESNNRRSSIAPSRGE